MVTVGQRAVESCPEAAGDDAHWAEALFREAKRRERRRRLLKAGAAALIVLSVVVTAVLYATGQPKPPPNQAGALRNLSKTNGAAIERPVFYLQPLNQQNTLDAYNWDGTEVRTIRTAIPILSGAFSQSPSGAHIVSASALLDSDGQVVKRHADFVIGAWSGNGNDLCSIGPAEYSQDLFKGPVDLYVSGLNERMVQIAKVGQEFPETDYDVVSCMPSLHRALVTENIFGRTDSEILVDFKDRTHPSVERNSVIQGSPCDQPTAISDDGIYQASFGSQGGVVCTRATHKIVAHFAGEASGIDSDGDLVTVISGPTGFTPEVDDWRTGKILWRGGTTRVYPSMSAQFEQGGSGVAFSVVTSFQPYFAQGWLVRPGKNPRLLLSAVTPGTI
jgi:hypothetical protein